MNSLIIFLSENLQSLVTIGSAITVYLTLKNTISKDFKSLDKSTKEQFQKIDKRFDKIDERFTKVDERFTKVDEKLQILDSRVSRIEGQLIGPPNWEPKVIQKKEN